MREHLLDEDHNIVFVIDGNDASSVARFSEHLEGHGCSHPI